VDHRLTPALAVEVITLPVSNVDRAVRFYPDKVGFEMPLSGPPATPTSSSQTWRRPGGRLVKRGVQVSEIRHKTPAGAWDGGFAPGLDSDRGDYASIADFDDAANTWVLQERRPRHWRPSPDNSGAPHWPMPRQQSSCATAS